MSQSICKIYVHIIFHIKTTSPRIHADDLDGVHAYIGQIIDDTNCNTIWVDGVGDHVHALCVLGRDTTVSHLVEEMKRNSSRWIKSISPHYKGFSWQGGYAAYAVSQSMMEKTLAYIKGQKEHHKKMTFREEYRRFLELYHVEYDERYVFGE